MPDGKWSKLILRSWTDCKAAETTSKAEAGFIAYEVASSMGGLAECDWKVIDSEECTVFVL